MKRLTLIGIILLTATFAHQSRIIRAQKIHIPGGKVNSMPGGIRVTVAGEIGYEYRMSTYIKVRSTTQTTAWVPFNGERIRLAIYVSDDPTTASNIHISARRVVQSKISSTKTLPDVMTRHLLAAIFRDRYQYLIELMSPALRNKFVKQVKDDEKARVKDQSIFLEKQKRKLLSQFATDTVITTDTK